MVRLVPMTESDFEGYVEQSIVSYAQEHVQSGNWDPSEALQKSREQFEQLLPEGLATENQHLFSVEEGETGALVGRIWFGERGQPSRRTAFIYDFLIHEPYRGRGYGKQTLAALEEKVRELGIETIALHVFGHNRAAINLYQRVGYEITNLHMQKRVGG